VVEPAFGVLSAGIFANRPILQDSPLQRGSRWNCDLAHLFCPEGRITRRKEMRIITAIAILGLATTGALAEGTSTSPSSSSPSLSTSGQNAAYCLEKSGGQKTCSYATMAACEAVKTGSDKCSPNPSASTTGAASSGSSSSSSTSPPSSSSPSSR
jgi:hypothetical protein